MYVWIFQCNLHPRFARSDCSPRKVSFNYLHSAWSCNLARKRARMRDWLRRDDWKLIDFSSLIFDISAIMSSLPSKRVSRAEPWRKTARRYEYGGALRSRSRRLLPVSETSRFTKRWKTSATRVGMHLRLSVRFESPSPRTFSTTGAFERCGEPSSFRALPRTEPTAYRLSLSLSLSFWLGFLRRVLSRRNKSVGFIFPSLFALGLVSPSPLLPLPEKLQRRKAAAASRLRRCFTSAV